MYIREQEAASNGIVFPLLFCLPNRNRLLDSRGCSAAYTHFICPLRFAGMCTAAAESFFCGLDDVDAVFFFRIDLNWKSLSGRDELLIFKLAAMLRF